MLRFASFGNVSCWFAVALVAVGGFFATHRAVAGTPLAVMAADVSQGGGANFSFVGSDRSPASSRAMDVVMNEDNSPGVVKLEKSSDGTYRAAPSHTPASLRAMEVATDPVTSPGVVKLEEGTDGWYRPVPRAVVAETKSPEEACKEARMQFARTCGRFALSVGTKGGGIVETAVRGYNKVETFVDCMRGAHDTGVACSPGDNPVCENTRGNAAYTCARFALSFNPKSTGLERSVDKALKGYDFLDCMKSAHDHGVMCSEVYDPPSCPSCPSTPNSCGFSRNETGFGRSCPGPAAGGHSGPTERASERGGGCRELLEEHSSRF